MKPTLEMLQKHRDILDRFPADEPCACDPAYGRWCAFHAEFKSNMSHQSRELLGAVAARALSLHEAIQDYLAYPVTANHKKVSGAITGAETLIELYLKERDIDREREREALRKLREVGDTQE